MFPGLDLYCTDPVQPLTTAGEELDYPDHDLSDMWNIHTRYATSRDSVGLPNKAGGTAGDFMREFRGYQRKRRIVRLYATSCGSEWFFKARGGLTCNKSTRFSFTACHVCSDPTVLTLSAAAVCGPTSIAWKPLGTPSSREASMVCRQRGKTIDKGISDQLTQGVRRVNTLCLFLTMTADH